MKAIRKTLTCFVAVAALILTVRAESRVIKNVKLGQGLYEVAVSESTNSVYVSSTGVEATKIFILDATTLATKGTIDVDGAAPYGLGINDKTQTLYVSNTRAGNVTVYDLKTNRKIKTLKPKDYDNGHVFRVFVDEETNMIYVSAPATPSQIWVIDGNRNEIVSVIPDSGTRATGIAVNNQEKFLYSTNLEVHEIWVIDLKTGKIAKKFPSGGQRPTNIIFDAKTKRLFVTNQGSGQMAVLDSDSGKVLKLIDTGAAALGIQFNPATNQIYVANREAGTVSVIDGAKLEVIAQLPTGTLPNTVAFHRKTNAVYVTNKAQRTPDTGNATPPAQDQGGDTVTMIMP